MQITVPPELAAALIAAAAQDGRSPEQLALAWLRQVLAAPSGTAAASDAAPQHALAAFLGDSIGVLHSSEHVPGGAHMSAPDQTTFRDGLRQNRQQGHL